MSAPGYYACLEVGRARNPSSEILEALARALVLDAAEREHPERSVHARGERPGPARPAAAGMTPARSRRSFSAAKPVACAVLTDIGRLPAAKVHPCLRLERLPQLIPGGYRGIRRGRLEWIQVGGIPGQPRGPA